MACRLLCLILGAVAAGSWFREGLDWNFLRLSSAPAAVSNSVASSAAKSSEPVFSLARINVA